MTMQKWYVFGGFGYHGNLLVFFDFWFLVCRVSNFVRKYSRSGLECPLILSFLPARRIFRPWNGFPALSLERPRCSALPPAFADQPTLWLLPPSGTHAVCTRLILSFLPARRIFRPWNSFPALSLERPRCSALPPAFVEILPQRRASLESSGAVRWL